MELSFIYNVFRQQFKRPNNVVVGDIVIDSRLVKKGDIFFAIVGETFDGHDFIPQALAKEAGLVIASKTARINRDEINDEKIIFVNDTIEALGQLAKAWRQKINPYVIGITGSSGKTTVKELTAAILNHRYGTSKVLYTSGNLNNHIGVPLTLLKLTEQHQFAVIEMGMNHFGELAYLTQIALPDIAIVNNVLRAHIGCGFNGIEDIARAKAEIFTGLSATGVAVLPSEDSQVELLKQTVNNIKIRSFGIHYGDVYATNIDLRALSSSFTVHCELGQQEIHVPVPGLHNIHNSLAAVSLLIDIPQLQLSQIASGISLYQSQQGRLHISQLQSGSILIDDSYNANPDSMKAAITVLASMPSPKILVMGDMGELGENSPLMHQEIGLFAKQQGIDYLLAVGNETQFAVNEFTVGGQFYASKQQLLIDLLQLTQHKASILVKGSRFMKMEQIAKELIKE